MSDKAIKELSGELFEAFSENERLRKVVIKLQNDLRAVNKALEKKCDKVIITDDETIEALCGIPSLEMRDHLEVFHPRPDRKLLQCPDCGMFFKILHPTEGVCQKCHNIHKNAKHDGIAEACYSKEMREHTEE